MARIDMLELADLHRAGLRRLVDACHMDVWTDELLGPIFTKVIGEDREPHLSRIIEFWRTLMPGTRSCKGGVCQEQVAIADASPVAPEHFIGCIALWNGHIRRLFPGPIADQLQSAAAAVGRNWFFGFFGQFAHFDLRDGVALDCVAV